MATQLINGLWSLTSGSLSFVHNGANYGPVENVVDAYGVEPDSLTTVVFYRLVDGSVKYYQIRLGVVSSDVVATSEYDQAKISGTQIPDEGTPILFPVHVSEVVLDMSGNKIVNGSEAVSPDGFVVLRQLNHAIDSEAFLREAGDQVNADAIAALTTIVDNLDLNGGLTEAQVTAIADARASAAILTQFDNATLLSLQDQLRQQLSSVDTAILTDVEAVQGLIDALEPRVAATEATNAAQNLRLNAIETTDAAQAVQLASIEATNATQSTDIAALQSGLATQTSTNAAQEILLSGHTTAITNLNAVTAPIVVDVRNGIVSTVLGIAANAVSIDVSNANHMVVMINAAGRKYCEATFLRVLGGASEEATCHKYRAGAGDQYGFAIKKTVQGSQDATFILSGGSFF